MLALAGLSLTEHIRLLFFSWIWYLLLTVAPGFALNSLENTYINNITVSFANIQFPSIDTAIIRSCSLDSCFCIKARSLYCPITTFCLFKNDVTNFLWLSGINFVYTGLVSWKIEAYNHNIFFAAFTINMWICSSWWRHLQDVSIKTNVCWDCTQHSQN